MGRQERIGGSAKGSARVAERSRKRKINLVRKNKLWRTQNKY